MFFCRNWSRFLGFCLLLLMEFFHGFFESFTLVQNVFLGPTEVAVLLSLRWWALDLGIWA